MGQWALCRAKGCIPQSQDVDPFSVLQTSAEFRHRGSEGLGVDLAQLLAGSEAVCPQSLTGDIPSASPLLRKLCFF